MLCWPPGSGGGGRETIAAGQSAARTRAAMALPVLWPSLFRPCASRLPALRRVHRNRRRGPDHDYFPPELEAQILRCCHVEKWRIRDDRPADAARASRNRRPCPGAGWPTCASGGATATIEDRSYLPFIRDMLAKFPYADRQPAARDEDLRTRLSRRAQSFPCRHRLPSTTSASRALSAPAHAAREPAGAMRLGRFGHLVIGRSASPLMAFVLVLSFSLADLHCASFSTPARRISCVAIWRRLPHGTTSRGSHFYTTACAARRAGAARGRDPLQPGYARLRRALSLRTPVPSRWRAATKKAGWKEPSRFVRGAFFAARTFKDIDDLERPG